MNATIVSANDAPTTVLSAAPTRTSLSGTRRPARALLFYYVLRAFSTGHGFVVMLPLLFFRYHALRYDLDAEGVTVRWGVLFRREVTLTYARIQDINLVSNLIERWLGLGWYIVSDRSLRRHRDAGLGDLDDRDDTAPLLEPARELAREARLLRATIFTPPS